MRPPQHSIDASPILVLRDDPAWDTDRIDREIDGLSDEDRAAHPVERYNDGDTRYDLTAKSTWKGGTASAGEYLNGGAVMYHLRRLKLAHEAEVNDAVTRELSAEGANAFQSVWLKAAMHGIADITGADDISFAPRPGPVPERVLRTVIDRHGGWAAITKIGSAAWTISQALSEGEKKA